MVELLILSVAIVVTASAHMVAVGRIVAPLGEPTPPAPVLRERVAWVVDIASGLGSIAMALVALFDPGTRRRAAIVLLGLLLFVGWLWKIRRSSIGPDERDSAGGANVPLTAYPRLWPWSRQPKFDLLGLFLDIASPGVVVQLATLGILVTA